MYFDRIRLGRLLSQQERCPQWIFQWQQEIDQDKAYTAISKIVR